MKRILIIASLLFLGLGAGAYCDDSPLSNAVTIVTISLESVSQLALANSLDIQIAKFDAAISQTSLGKAVSIFDTILTAAVGANDDETASAISSAATKTREDTYSLGFSKKLPTGTTVTIDGENKRTNSDSSLTPINPYHQATAGASVTQAIGKNFFGLADRNDIKITKIDIENSRYTSLDDIETALYNVQAGYWNFVLKDSELKIAVEMLKKAQTLYNIYAEKYEVGLIEKVDLFAVDANLKTRENNVLIAQLGKETAKNNLLFLLNEQNLSVQLQPLDLLTIDPDDEAVSLDVSLREALQHRRDYKKAQNSLKKNNIDIVTKKNSLWPEIDLKATFTRNGIQSQYKESWQNISDQDNAEMFLGLTIKLPIENRMAKSELKEAELTKQQLILSFTKTERLIIKELNNIVKEINSLKNQIRLYSSVVTLQQNKLEEETKRLKYGRSNSDIIIRYEEDLLGARLNMARTRFQYRLALSKLKLSKNTLLDRYWEEVL